MSKGQMMHTRRHIQDIPLYSQLFDQFLIHKNDFFVFVTYELASGAVNTPYWEMADNDMADQAVHSYYNPVTQPVFDTLMKGRISFAEGSYKGHKLLLISPHPEMGNIGYQTRKDSLNFLLVYNGLFYLSAKENL